ncbi:amino acid racemase [Halorubrum sp. BOL3-1]|uniref:aspartate/glutamate racemase family protein n=1 Tax=Halorubrum sp. BOL3-1 TaxID=2497325 RepID=UPI001004FB62|nr:amino acid racemase [Halorubrum sp. BOL3-1]QAU13195.1 amino acid racemase [Halorubrum sp. BOL3-1]
MQTIGILGGMAPESTLEYYRQIIDASHDRGWVKRYPRTVIHSLNFEEFYEPLSNGEDGVVLGVLLDGIESLANAGADFAILASNTPHQFFDQLTEESPIPLVSIVTATAAAATAEGYERVGVLGTLFTMNGQFYPEGFDAHGLDVVTPPADEKEWTHRKIFGELTNGRHTAETKQGLIDIIRAMAERSDIDAVALACTELPLILDPDELPVPALNTTALHARYAFDKATDDDG